MQWGFYEPNTLHDAATLASTRNLDALINRKSEIIHCFAQWNNPYDQAFASHLPWMTAAKAYGATPMITWEAFGAPLGDIVAAKWDAYIDSWAAGLGAYGGPVILRLFHEADYIGTNGYPWGLNTNTPAQIIAAFRYVHDRVKAKATNVQFGWAVNIWSPAGPVQEVLFPGDACVDWVGIDIYNWAALNGSPWSSLASGLTAIYARLAALSAKPMMLSEWSSAEPSGGEVGVYTKGQWIKDAVNALVTQFPRITAAVWFSNTGTTWALDSSPDSLAGAKVAFGSPPVDPVLTAVNAARADIAIVQATLNRIFK